jgi:predicted small secreted protein
MSKLLDLLDLLRKGSAVTDPKLWKDRAALTLALTALILTGCRAAKGFGYEIPISETDAASIAAGVAVLVGLFSTYATATRWDYSLPSLCRPTAGLTLYEPTLNRVPPTMLWSSTSEPTQGIQVEAVSLGFKCRF